MKRGKSGKKIWLLLLVIAGVLLLSLLVLGIQSEAVDFLPTELDLDVYLYNKYSIKNYQVDLWIDTSGNWIPWNWLDGIDSSILSVFTFIFNVLYMIAVYIWYFIGYFVQQIYKMDLINTLSDGIEGYIQKIAGFDGELGSGLLNEFLIILIIASGAYLLWKGMIKRETGEAVSWIVKFMALFVFSLFFYAKASTLMTNANDMVAEVNTKIASAFVEGDTTADVSIREGLFKTTILNPYLLFQYGKTDVEQEIYDALLSKAPSSDERKAIVKDEVQNLKNEYMTGWDGLFYRIIMGVIILLVNLIIALVCLVTSALSIYHQLVFLVLIFFAPFIFIYGMLPGKASVVFRWLEKMAYHLFLTIGITLLFTVMFTFSEFVMELAASNGGYMLSVMLQAVIFICVFFMRNKIFDLFTENRNPKSGPSISDMYYLSRAGSNLLSRFGGGEDKGAEDSGLDDIDNLENAEEGLMEGEKENYDSNGMKENTDLAVRGENTPEEKGNTPLKEYEYEGDKQNEIDATDENLIERNPAVDEEENYVEPDAVKIYDEDGNLEYDSETEIINDTDETVEENVDVSGADSNLEVRDSIDERKLAEDEEYEKTEYEGEANESSGFEIRDESEIGKDVTNEQEIEMEKELDSGASIESHDEFERPEYNTGPENSVTDENSDLYDRSDTYDTEESLGKRQMQGNENVYFSDDSGNSLYENNTDVQHSYDEQNVQIDSEETNFNERGEDM